MAKQGRPKAITPTVEAALLTMIMNGDTAAEACRKLHVSYSTVARKQIEDTTFAGSLARAREAGAWRNADEAEDKLRNAKDGVDIMRARELAIHLRWKCSALLRPFNPRLAIEGPPGDNAIGDPRDRFDAIRRIAFALKIGGDEAARRTQLRLAAPSAAPVYREVDRRQRAPIEGEATTVSPSSGEAEKHE
jgi:hypothetical protein